MTVHLINGQMASLMQVQKLKNIMSRVKKYGHVKKICQNCGLKYYRINDNSGKKKCPFCNATFNFNLKSLEGWF